MGTTCGLSVLNQWRCVLMWLVAPESAIQWVSTCVPGNPARRSVAQAAHSTTMAALCMLGPCCMHGLKNGGKCLLADSTPSIQADREVLSDMAIDVEDNYNGLEICGVCRMEGATKRKRMMVRSRRSNNAMASNVDNKNFHLQHMEQQRAVHSGRGGHRWEGGCEEITTSRDATSCDAWCVRKTAKSADAVVHNLEQLLHSRQVQGSITCRTQRLWRLW
jgi:hypothetical protein